MRAGGAAVADDETTETTEDAAPSNAELASRIDGLAADMRSILDKLSGTKDEVHEEAAEHTRERLDRPSEIAYEMRRQFEERDRTAAATAQQRADAEWRKGVDERLTGMAEKTPEAPLRRVEKIMGWR